MPVIAVLMDTPDLPPTQKGRHYEARAQGLREFAGLKSDHERLDPFALAKYANLLVADFELIQNLSDEARNNLLGEGKDSWSGGAASKMLPDGRRLIILNPTHGRNRHKATLMEEISHVFLGHKPSRLAIEARDRTGQPLARDYHAEIEEEAYATGAAALVPFRGLNRMVEQGKLVPSIARHYGVSRPLIEYRLKVSRLWERYCEMVFLQPPNG